VLQFIRQKNRFFRYQAVQTKLNTIPATDGFSGGAPPGNRDEELIFISRPSGRN